MPNFLNSEQSIIFPGLSLQEKNILYLTFFSTMHCLGETGWDELTDFGY
jgi:hypothetical protein